MAGLVHALTRTTRYEQLNTSFFGVCIYIVDAYHAYGIALKIRSHKLVRGAFVNLRAVNAYVDKVIYVV